MNFKSLFENFRYYLHKVRSKLLARFLVTSKGFQEVDEIAFYKKPSQFKFSGKVVFCFWDPRIIHLGDQLFFEPLIRALDKKFEVKIVTYSAMEDYFSELGYNTCSLGELNPQEVEDAALIFKEILPQVERKFPKNNLLVGLDFTSPSGSERITSLIFKTVAEVLRRTNVLTDLSVPENFCPAVADSLLKKYEQTAEVELLSNKGQEFILFNNYIASHFLGVNEKNQEKLEEIAKEKKKQGFSIVHLGTEQEKERDSDDYKFVDYDLRGKTSPLQLFKILSLNNVKGIISFDTFPMHVASILKKDVYTMVRGRSDPQHEQVIKDIFIPMASCLEDKVEIID